MKQGMRRLPEPNWADLALTLKKPGVTLMLPEGVEIDFARKG